MNKTYTYKPQGTCSVQMTFTLDEHDIIEDFSVVGGCPGNLSGIRALIIGMDAHEVIRKLKGVTCRTKMTSCPDQLARGLEEMLKEEKVQ